MSELQQRVGGRVKRLRVKRNMSQGDIARKLGVHRSYISGIERGTRNPTIKNLDRIADALGVSLSALLK